MKKSLNEHIGRMKYLTNYSGKKSLNENMFIQEEAPIDPNFEREMQTALGQIMHDLPNELNNLARNSGDHDGQLELAGDQQQNPQQVQNEGELKEAIGMLAAGAVLALPAITNMVGKAAQFLGKKIDNQTMQDFGVKTKNFAHKMHHSYEGVIDKILSPLTRNLDPAKRKIVNQVVFYTIVATFFGIGATGAVGAAGAGKAGLAAAEGGLSTVKASELVAAAKEIIPKVLSSMGLIS